MYKLSIRSRGQKTYTFDWEAWATAQMFARRMTEKEDNDWVFWRLTTENGTLISEWFAP